MRQVIHIIAEYIGCKANHELFTNLDALMATLREEVRKAGLETVAEAGYSFGEGCGVTGSIVLAESHMNIHTWPERDFYCNIDISVCNYSCDNFPKALDLANALKTVFKPLDVNEKIIKGYRDFEDDKYTEYFSSDSGFFIKPNQVLYRSADELQQVEVYDTKDFGRVLRIDNFFQTSERDEAFYHEPLIHPAMIAHPNPEKVLIIGAGDGGVLHNVLKHKCVKKAVMVEISDMVIEVSKKYLPMVHKGAFEDPRAQVIIQDGLEYIAGTDEKFDVILLDLTDPIGPARALYTNAFYAKVKSALKDQDGILALHTEYPFYHPKVYGRINQTLRSLFKKVTNGFNFVPIYGTIMGFGYCSDRTDPKALSPAEVQNRLVERGVTDLKLYNSEMHFSFLAEPAYVKQILSQEHEVITPAKGLDEFMQTYNVARD
ncbi:MAG: polyamine aminopropyltransferase [bacterium]|nr:polyamine aminopropyltransferase [bacterium]